MPRAPVPSSYLAPVHATALALLLFATNLALGAAANPARAAANSCLQAASTAEQSLALPAGLLRAIGSVETGNQPWSVDVDGSGRRFASAQQAVDFVQSARQYGGRYIDVGCFQLDLHYHPDAFAALDVAFDPLANALAAGRFLRELRATAASWPAAVARYHSALADAGQSYSARVYAALGEPLAALEPAGRADEIVAFGIHIIIPDAAPPHQGAIRMAGLPTVYTP